MLKTEVRGQRLEASKKKILDDRGQRLVGRCWMMVKGSGECFGEQDSSDRGFLK